VGCLPVDACLGGGLLDFLPAMIVGLLGTAQALQLGATGSSDSLVVGCLGSLLNTISLVVSSFGRFEKTLCVLVRCVVEESAALAWCELVVGDRAEVDIQSLGLVVFLLRGILVRVGLWGEAVTCTALLVPEGLAWVKEFCELETRPWPSFLQSEPSGRESRIFWSAFTSSSMVFFDAVAKSRHSFSVFPVCMRVWMCFRACS